MGASHMWQLQLTVNQPSLEFIGSSPLAPTIKIWKLGVVGLSRKIEALEAEVRFLEFPLNFMI